MQSTIRASASLPTDPATRKAVARAGIKLAMMAAGIRAVGGLNAARPAAALCEAQAGVYGAMRETAAATIKAAQMEVPA